MTAIESGDGQYVHESENDAEESGHQPERVPVPHGWEQAADGTESAERLGAVCREHIFHVADISCQHVAAVLSASGERGEESVVDMCRLVVVEQGLHSEAELQLVAEHRL